MFGTKCDECGKNTTVPFKPKEGKPVYCSICFSKRVSDKRMLSKPKPNFDLKNAWARRGTGFKGRREEEPTSIFQRYL